MPLVAIGVGAITLASLLLGWALLVLSEVSARSAARRDSPQASVARAAPASNTLRAVESPARRRRRQAVSSQVPRMRPGPARGARGVAPGAVAQ